MNSDLPTNARLLGYVQLRVGQEVYAVPVQAVKFDRDARSMPGGFFDSEGQLGILVDSEADDDEVQAQILSAAADAVKHLSRKFMN